jgi:hypothetical protein
LWQAGKDTAEQQARLLDERVRGLSNRVRELENNHETASQQARRAEDELRMHRAQTQEPVMRGPQSAGEMPDDSISEEYEGLLKELADAGLKDPGDVDHLLTAMKGPPATDAHVVRAMDLRDRDARCCTLLPSQGMSYTARCVGRWLGRSQL